MVSLIQRQTVTKPIGVRKFACGGGWLFLSILLIFCAILTQAPVARAESASTIPVVVSWPQPETNGKSYLIEISNDARFGTTLLRTQITGTSLPWAAPAEGVYHWRVIPQDRIQEAGVESSNFASGSFIAVAQSSTPGQEMPITWSVVPGVNSYYIHMQESSPVSQHMAASVVAKYTVVRSASPMMVYIEPHGGTARAGVVSHFDPGLRIVKAEPVKVDATPRELVVGNVPLPEPVEAPKLEPLPPAPAPVEFSSGPREEILYPDGRGLELLLGVLAGTEKIYGNKGPTATLLSRNQVVGAMAQFRTIPTEGLHVGASGTYHLHRAEWKDQDGVRHVAQNLTRYAASATLGWDLLSRLKDRKHQLVLEARGSMTKMYHLPVAYEDLDMEGMKGEDVMLVGGGGWYRWSMKRYGAGIFGSRVVQPVGRSSENDASIDEFGAFVAIDAPPSFTVNIGGMSRLTILTKCSSNVTSCKEQGFAATRLSEIMGWLSIGYVLY